MSKISQVYGVGQALFNLLPPPQLFQTAPTAAQDNYSIGQIGYVGTPGAYEYYIYSGAGVWEVLSPSGGAITAVAGTTNQITATTASGVVTLTIPTTFIAPGSIAATTTVTGGTGVIATTGNLTASAAASGLLLTPTVASGAQSGTVAANGRVVSVTFTGISIAGGAALALTTSNTSITGSGTLILPALIGATTGSALTIQSTAQTAGQSVITVTNATGATTTTANITINYFVLN